MKIYKRKRFYQWFTIIYLFFVVPTYAQQNSNDTTFIFRDSLYGTSQSIFIENNKSSKYYDKLNDFDFDKFYKENYEYSIKILKRNKIVLEKQKPVIPITKWLNLKQCNDKFYVYYPCDFYNYYQTSINDSAYVEWTGEGLIAKQINSQIEINDSTFQF